MHRLKFVQISVILVDKVRHVRFWTLMELTLATLIFWFARGFLNGLLPLLFLQIDLAGAHIKLFKDVGRERGLIWQVFIGCL